MKVLVLLVGFIAMAASEQCMDNKDCDPANCAQGNVPLCITTGFCTCVPQIKPTGDSMGTGSCTTRSDCQTNLAQCHSHGLQMHCVDGMCKCTHHWMCG